MSTIDDRIVRMEFDNKQFESGVSTTMSTLEKLKEALKFRGSVDGFDDIQKASNNLSFSPINDGIYQVQQNFSFLGEFVRTVFDRISNTIIDLGSTLVRGVTIDPLRDGFAEYDLQMTSTQTIMASTGKSIDEVTAYLDELNTYADKTIYSFSDMTQNIGKFTNAGVDLDVAVKAIQGISNEAAVSGANAQEASRAMYNFAQALSAGSVKLIDWKSIENANMATKKFKEQLLETAVEMGTVTKTANGMYQVVSKNAQGGTMKDAIDATHNFNDSLSYQWMTTDVLTTTLAKYADETTEIGAKAFEAATQIKTFGQLVDTVKESLGSGWTKSFQYIIGNLEEAKVLWTGVNAEIEAILNPIADAREAMLKFWHDNGGRDAAIQAIADAWQGVKAVMSAVADVFDRVFPPMTGERLVEITTKVGELASRFRDFATSSQFLTKVRGIFSGVLGVVKMLVNLAKSAANILFPLVDIFSDFAGVLFDAAYRLGLFVFGLSNTRTPIEYIQSSLSSLSEIVRNVINGIENLVKSLLDLVGIHLEGNPIADLLDTISEFASSHIDFSFPDDLARKLSFVKGVLKGLVTGEFDTLTKHTLANMGVIDKASVLAKGISGALSGLLDPASKVSGHIKGATDALSGFSDTASKVVEHVKGVTDGFDVLSGVGGKVSGLVKGIAESFSGLSSTTDDTASSFGIIGTVFGGLSTILSTIGGKIADFAAWIGESLPHAFEFLGSQEFADIIANFNALLGGGLLLSLRNFVDVLSESKGGKKSGIADIFTGLFGGVTEKASDVLDGLSDALSGFQESVNANALIKIAVAVGILAGSLSVLASIEPDRMANGIAGMASAMGVLVGMFKVLSTTGGQVESFGMSNLASALIKMAVAVGVLSLVVKMLSGLDMDSLSRGLIGVGSALAMLTGAMILLTRFGGDVEKPARGMITFSIAIGILALSVKYLSELRFNSLVKGLIGVGALLAGIVVFSKLVNSGSLTLKSAASVVVLALAMKVLSSTVAFFGEMNLDSLKKGLSGVAVLFIAIMALSQWFNSNSTMTLGSAVTILAIAAAVKILESTVVVFANVNGLKKGLIGVAGLLAGVAALAFVVGKSSLTAGAAVSVVILAAAVAMLADVAVSLGSMNWKSLETGLVGLGFSIVALVTALVVLQTGTSQMLVGAAAIMVMAVALRVFVPVLTTLAGMDIGGIIQSFLTLGAALAVLAVGSVVLSAIAPMIFTAAAAIGVFGIACGVLGVGIGLASAGIIAFAAAMTTSAASVITNAGIISVGIISLATSIVTGIVQGIVTGVVTLLESIGEILGALSVAIHAIGNFLLTNVPYVLSVVGSIVISVLSLLTTFVPQLVGVVVQFVVALLQTIITWLPVIAQTLVTGVVTLINSVANGIRDNSEAILAAIRNILSSVIELVLTALADIVRLIPGVGDTLAGFIEDGKDEVRNALAPESFESMSGEAMDSAISGFEKGGSDLSTIAGDIGTGAHDSLVEGFGDSDGIADDFMQPIVDGLGGYEGDFSEIGDADFEALLSSFNDSGSGASDEMMQSILGGLQGYEGEFASIGDIDVEAFTSAFTSSSAADEAGSLAGTAVEGLDSKSSLFDTSGKTDANAFANALGNATGTARSKGSSLASSGAGGAASKKGAFISTGGDLASGFNYGVASPYALSLARAKGIQIGNAAIGGIRSSIQSASPSKKAMKLGRYTSQGFAIGISSLTKYVYKESEGVGQKALDGISESLGQMSKYLDEDLEVDPTITPVMDLSEIQNGIAQMNQIVDNGVPTPLLGVGLDAYAQRMMSGMTNSNFGGFSNGSSDDNSSTVYNVYIDGARINDDEAISAATYQYLMELSRKGAMNVGR